MEFALIVYGIEMISNIGILLVIGIIVSAMVLFYHAIEVEIDYRKTWKNDFQKKFLIVPIVIAIVLTFIPTKPTMYLMIGAYASQTALQSQLGQDVLQVIELKVKEQIEELKSKSK